MGKLGVKVDSNNGLNIVGKRVKLARLRRKTVLTQAQLAQRLAELGTPIDRAGIAKLESGIRCVLDYEIVALAGALAEELKLRWLQGASCSGSGGNWNIPRTVNRRCLFSGPSARPSWIHTSGKLCGRR